MREWRRESGPGVGGGERGDVEKEAEDDGDEEETSGGERRVAGRGLKAAHCGRWRRKEGEEDGEVAGDGRGQVKTCCFCCDGNEGASMTTHNFG